MKRRHQRAWFTVFLLLCFVALVIMTPEQCRQPQRSIYCMD